VYADDQRVGGEDSLDEVHLTPDVVVRGDEGDVLIASVMNETGRRLIGPRTTMWRGWVCVGVEEGVTDVPLVQRVPSVAQRCGISSGRVAGSNQIKGCSAGNKSSLLGSLVTAATRPPSSCVPPVLPGRA
jgi:hypothetical protein